MFQRTPLSSGGSEAGSGGSSNLPMSNLASLLLSAESDQDSPQSGVLSGSGVPSRSGRESGVITPDEVSNVTSSDAATVHSSASGMLE